MNDGKYETESSISGLILLFSKGLVELEQMENKNHKILEHLKPDYP
jgi:hypothetical protein